MKKLKKETNDTVTKDIRSLFRLKKENKAIKGRIIKEIRNLFEHEEGESYYKPLRISNFWSNNNIEHKSNRNRNKTLSVKKHLTKIRPYLKW